MRTLAIIGIVLGAIGITIGMKNFFGSIMSMGNMLHHFPFRSGFDFNLPQGGMITLISGYLLAVSIIVLKKHNETRKQL
jgi:hypothetical protein